MYNWAPGEMLYAMERVGDLPTRTGKLNLFIEKFVDNPEEYADNYAAQSVLAEECGFEWGTITDKEYVYIMEELEKRL